jgi:tRNA (guanosine-2'-O-)-methyltransferase
MSSAPIDPENRREFSKTQPPKPNKWPRTERRQQRLRSVLSRRQPDLVVVLENVFDAHNASAVLRSCDAVGVLEVHLVYDVEEPPECVFARTTSSGTAKWMDIHRHESVEACYAALREKQLKVLVTALQTDSLRLYESDLASPVALVFGNEQRGASEQAVALADGTIYIPMLGVVESLNISVACAVTLYEALRQRQEAGLYDSPRLNDEELASRLDAWLRR